MNDSAKKTIAALTAAVVVLTVLLGGATAAAVIFAVQRNDATAWFYVDGELYRTVTAKDGKVDCPDVPAVSDTVRTYPQSPTPSLTVGMQMRIIRAAESLFRQT